MSLKETESVDKNKIIVLGYPHWAKVVVKTLRRAGFEAKHFRIEQEYVPAVFRWLHPLRKIIYPLLTRVFHRASAIHIVGIVRVRPLCRLARLFGKKVFFHWVGTDVLKVSESVESGNHRYLGFYQKVPNAHFAGAPILIEELEQLGIKAEFFPTLSKSLIPEKQVPIPDKPGVLCYWSHERRDFYRGDILDALAEDFPDVTFYIAGSDGKGEPQHPNVKYLGWVDGMEDVYRKTNILIRMPEHDGLGAMVLEMLAHGRWVIRNYKFPHTEFASNLEEARSALRRCLEREGFKEAGREYVLENFSPEAVVKQIRPVYEQALMG
jgi:glycosyltransferase involved in cell wall biosynthesis